MTDEALHDRLIVRLAADLRPVRRLPSPWLQAGAWTLMIVAFGLALMAVADLGAVRQQLRGSAAIAWALAGSATTALAAALAAFQTSVPGSDRRWALLPLPPLGLWLGASGAGCLNAPTASASEPALMQTGECLAFILGVSLPLAALMLALLSRALPLHPALTAGLGGLAAAAAAATLLALFHPFDIAWLDLLVHAIAVAVVVLVSRTFGPRYLAEPST